MSTTKEIRTEETAIYMCHICGQAIICRLPKGLQGEFTHVRCSFPDDHILDAEVIDFETCQ